VTKKLEDGLRSARMISCISLVLIAIASTFAMAESKVISADPSKRKLMYFYNLEYFLKILGLYIVIL